MNEDEVLAQLRDIHLPAELAVAAPITFAAWPIIAVAGIGAAILLARYWQRNRWRRHASADLSRIERVEDAAAQWSMLLGFAGGLAQRAGHAVTLPALAYRHPATITDTERAEFISHLSAEVRR
ncbi:MAG: DUF4381 family protein [Alphaproteobacteria bacterium]